MADQTLRGVNPFVPGTAQVDPEGSDSRTGRAIQATERRFHALLNALPVAIYTTDAAGRITFFNDAAVAFSGRHPTLGSDEWCVTWRLFRPDGAPMPHDECPMAIALKEGREIRDVEAIAERPDGSRVPFMPYPTLLRDDDGKVVGAVNLLLDLTDRRRAEDTLRRFNDALEQRVVERTRALQEAELSFRLLVEGVTDYAIFMLDPAGIVSSWNTGAARIKGYRADEILGQHFSRFYTEEDRAAGKANDALAAAAREGRFETEAWRVRKDGQRFWAGIVLDAIRDSAGKLIGFAKITRDLTERRAMEEQLRQAQKMEAVGQLTGGIAHDFNNLLGAIVPSLELARMHVQDPAALRYLDSAAHAANRGAKLTHQLLSFARKQELVIRVVDVNALILSLGELLPRTIGPTVMVETAPSREPLFATTDATQLESALLNLAINARDAMPLGGSLRISTALAEPWEVRRAGLEEPGDYVTIAITDTGSGMSDDVRQRAFEPFFTTKSNGTGSGLGLSMVYGFAKQSSGITTIESTPGQGTTVRLFLPRAAATAYVADQAEAATLDAGPPARVLVIDDDDDVRSVTGALLRSFGHEAVEVDSGSRALDLLGHDRAFDVMVVDLMMPTMHGAVFAGRARAIAPELPAIFVTGYAGMHWHGEGGNQVVLRKPFRRADLAERLRAILGPGSGATAAAV